MHPFRRKDAAKPPPAPLARVGLLESKELASLNSNFPGFQKKVMAALRAHFKHFASSGISKAAGSSMHGVVKDNLLYLPIVCAGQNTPSGICVHRIVLNLGRPHENISITPAQFNSVKNPDAHLWACRTRALLDSVVHEDVARLESASGKPMEAVSAALVLRNKAKGKKIGEEITLHIALAC